MRVYTCRFFRFCFILLVTLLCMLEIKIFLENKYIVSVNNSLV